MATSMIVVRKPTSLCKSPSPFKEWRKGKGSDMTPGIVALRRDVGGTFNFIHCRLQWAPGDAGSLKQASARAPQGLNSSNREITNQLLENRSVL